MQVVMNWVGGAGVQQERLTETRVIGKDFRRGAVSPELAQPGSERTFSQAGKKSWEETGWGEGGHKGSSPPLEPSWKWWEKMAKESRGQDLEGS